jgi:heptosyltransferase-3
MNPVRLPENPRVLVVAMRRLGDVLLTTPLIRSVKRAFPQAAIDALVFAGTEGILVNNPDLAGILTIPQCPRAGENRQALRSGVIDAEWRPADLAGLHCRTAKRRTGPSERTWLSRQASRA